MLRWGYNHNCRMKKNDEKKRKRGKMDKVIFSMDLL
jgi:hypothetical protein